ncbi:HupE/UreJ family protein [Tsuneonella sp. SYSU-LHT278]|uniref:HupE/UreJ family protein n=1 Tax=Tsuneonella sediminis TaxID=3416089 RepID=UPI003F79019A
MSRLLAVVLVLLAGLSAPAAADELRPGYIEYRQRTAGEWSMAWKQPLVSRRTPRLAMPLVPAGCRVTDGPHGRTGALALIGNARLTCEGTLTGKRIGYRDVPGGGDVLVRVMPLAGEPQNYRLVPSRPFATVAAAPASTQVWRTYGTLGVHHILAGWDHLLFVIALVLLVRRGWGVVKAVTAFTLAHSLTLAGVTLGLVGLPQRPVEALIALSIVLVARELLRPPEPATLARRFPWLVAFVFGLIHGFGFAGALAEIGLPEGEVPAALLAFNLGVEAGQLAVVGSVILVLAAARRIAPGSLGPGIRLAAYATGATASYWLVARLVA